MKFFSTLLLICVCGLLTACADDGLESRLIDYSDRLARVLEEDVPPPVNLELPQFPDKRALYVDIPDLSIDLLDFLRLGDCELQGVVADKNSSLGRFAAESIVLRQDLDFLKLGRLCASSLDDVELQATLNDAIERKQQDIPLRSWNALIAGPEYRALWTKDAGGYPSNIESRMEYALTDLQRSVDTLMEIKNGMPLTRDLDDGSFYVAYEAALGILRSGEAGALLASWHHVALNLNQATRIAKNRLERKPLCYPQMSNPSAQYFRNLVVEKFVGDLQRDIAVLNKRYYEVIVPLQVIEERFIDVETSAYKQFREQRDRFFEHSRREVKAHVAALEPLMLQCGFLSQAPTS